ncbi:MAG: hypothetical protein ACI965_000322 [Paraglaciecola sp.]|jgi:hypothetical protein
MILLCIAHYPIKKTITTILSFTILLHGRTTKTVGTIQYFINAKASQLTYFIRAFLNRRIAYSEMELYFWDTMEEWSQVKIGKHLPCGQREIVFWHLLYQMHYWPEQTLLNDLYLRSQLNTCLEYLESEHPYPLPLDCIGMRP